jgi:hypothetical protein
MNATTYLARAEAARSQATEATGDFVEAIRGIMIIKGMDSSDASVYTLGYLESFFARTIAELPAMHRNKIIKELNEVTLAKLNATKELA